MGKEERKWILLGVMNLFTYITRKKWERKKGSGCGWVVMNWSNLIWEGSCAGLIGSSSSSSDSSAQPRIFKVEEVGLVRPMGINRRICQYPPKY